MAVPTRDDQPSQPKPTDCPVCYEEIKTRCTTKCSHDLCLSCALEWFDTSNTCPICRTEVHQFGDELSDYKMDEEEEIDSDYDDDESESEDDDGDEDTDMEDSDSDAESEIDEFYEEWHGFEWHGFEGAENYDEEITIFDDTKYRERRYQHWLEEMKNQARKEFASATIKAQIAFHRITGRWME